MVNLPTIDMTGTGQNINRLQVRLGDILVIDVATQMQIGA